MATYEDLYTLWQDDTLKRQLAIAVMVEAEVINQELVTTPNHIERRAWAARALALPTTEGQRMLGAVLAANQDLTVAQIQGASDAAIQAKVSAAVDLVAMGIV